MIHYGAALSRAYAAWLRYLIIYCCGIFTGLAIESAAVRLLVAMGVHP